MLHCESPPGKPGKSPQEGSASMSQQLAFSSIASVLAMACLCLAAGSLERVQTPAFDTLAVATADAALIEG
jgi:hypothetical protein